MAFLNKLNDLASVASGKASGALEIGKLNLKVNSEEKKVVETIQAIGVCLLRSLDAGQKYDEVIMGLFAEINASRASITSMQSEIANLSGAILCPACAAKNPPDSKFCRACGTKLVDEPPVDTPVEIVETLCPTCGAVVTAEESFCTQCGSQLD